MRVLSVTHGPSVPGGVFEEVVVAKGHELAHWSVPLGGAPQPPASYGAVMVFGGSMHPDHDEHFPWLESEAGFLERVLTDDIPVIGVCLGAQMLARAAGAWVGAASSAEIGWHPVELTEEGRTDPVLGVLPRTTTAFQWHRYTYGIPGGGVELARSERCTQAFRVGRAWGIQFHAEVTQQMVEEWASEDPDDLPVDAGTFLDETATRIDEWNARGQDLCSAFLDVADAGRLRLAG